MEATDSLGMNPNQEEKNSPDNSEQKSKDEQSNEEKSEEYLNFEQGMRDLVSLSKEQVKRIIKNSPHRETDKDQ